MLLFWIFALMCFADVSQGQTTYYVEVLLGDPVTFLCRVSDSWYDVVITNAKEDVLYRYYESDQTGRVTYPDKHETNTTYSSYHYFTIKKADLEDTTTYSCYSEGSIHTKFVLDVYVTDNSNLINTVLEEGAFLRLAYHTKMENDTSVQWAFQRPQQTITDIYYADEEIGWVLPNSSPVFEKSDIGYGVIVRSMSFSASGKYQYFALKLPQEEQKVFEVALTRNLNCQSAPYLISGEKHFHTCSAEVSHGSIKPEFTILRDGEVMEGTLSSYNYTGNSIMYTYNQTFEASFDDSEVNFACSIKFNAVFVADHLCFHTTSAVLLNGLNPLWLTKRYYGIESNSSEFIDTSDPVYSDSCNFDYSQVESRANFVDIEPNSDDDPLILRIGQQLRCNSSGTSPVQYRWYCLGLSTVYNGSYLTITEVFFDQSIKTCYCFVNNTLSNGKFYFDTKTVRFQIAHTNNLLTPPREVIFQPVGESLHLDCTVAPYVNTTGSGGTYRYQWTADFSDDDDFIKHVIYTGKGDRYGIQDLWSEYFEEGEEKHDLVMKSADFGLAGRYRCEIIDLESPDLKFYYSDVHILDAVKCITPQKKIKRGETVGMECQIEHTGSIEPEIIWYTDDSAVSVSGPMKTLRKDFSSVKQVGVSVEAEPGVVYKCAVSFRSGKATYIDECTSVIDFDEEDGPNQQKPENETNKQ